MSAKELMRFADCFEDISRGVAKIKQKDCLPQGDHPVVDQGQDPIAGYSDGEDGLCTNVPAIVFGDHTRCVKYVTEPFFAGADGVKILKPKDSHNVRFWFHYLRSQHIEDLGYSRHYKLLKQCKFKACPLVEQELIALRLDHILRLIDFEESSLGKLEELVKSRFIEMFGDPIDESSPWPKLAIKDFCTLKIGPFGSSLHKQDYITGGRPLVNPSHIVDGKIVPANDLTISEEKYQEMEAYHLEPGDVVLGRRGEIGRCAVVYSSGYLCGTGSMIVRPSDKCRPDYLQRVLSFPSFKDALERNAVGQTMKNLNAKIVGQAVVALPSINAQNEFAAFVQQVEKLEFETQQAIDKLQTLYDSLAQEYFGD